MRITTSSLLGLAGMGITRALGVPQRSLDLNRWTLSMLKVMVRMQQSFKLLNNDVTLVAAIRAEALSTGAGCPPRDELGSVIP